MNGKNDKLFNACFYVGVTAYLLLCIMRLVAVNGSCYPALRELLIGTIFFSYTIMSGLLISNARRVIEAIFLVILYALLTVVFLFVIV